MKGSFKNGKEEGFWYNYWEDGKVKNASKFKNGLLNGPWKSYNQKQILIVSGSYKNGLKSGSWVDYFDNGRLMKKCSYKIIKQKNEIKAISSLGLEEKFSELHGKFESYSPNDFFIQAKGSYKKGLKTGTWYHYHPGGIVPMALTQFRNGDLHGLMRRFDRRGNLLSESSFKDGKKDGWFVIIGRNGKPKIKKFYKNGSEVIQKERNSNFFNP